MPARMKTPPPPRARRRKRRTREREERRLGTTGQGRVVSVLAAVFLVSGAAGLMAGSGRRTSASASSALR